MSIKNKIWNKKVKHDSKEEKSIIKNVITLKNKIWNKKVKHDSKEEKSIIKNVATLRNELSKKEWNEELLNEFLKLQEMACKQKGKIYVQKINNIQDKYGDTVLLYAYAKLMNYKTKLRKAYAKRGNLEQMIEYYSKIQVNRVNRLIESGIDINKKNNYGVNMLILASTFGDTKMVKKLIEKGANINEVDNQGKTALDWAEKGKMGEVIKILKLKGARNGKDIGNLSTLTRQGKINSIKKNTETVQEKLYKNGESKSTQNQKSKSTPNQHQYQI